MAAQEEQKLQEEHEMLEKMLNEIIVQAEKD